MCGIAGTLSTERALADSLPAVLRRMADSLRHRGPDASGTWCDPAVAVGLAHRRLSVVDPSDSGAQPMRSECGRWHITFNGEIYNYVDIRAELDRSGLAPVWRGASDTEVLIAACAAWGLDETLKRIKGMFAFALWDARSRALFLVRDRFGEKPLYVATLRGGIAFASELRAFAALPGWNPVLDMRAIEAYLRLGYVPSPLSIYSGVVKVEAGTYLRVDARTGASTEVRYYAAADVAKRGVLDRLRERPGDAIERIEFALRESVRRQLGVNADVGLLLSGGIDSSLLAGLMASESSRQRRTFTIGFGESAFDEADAARELAAHLGTEHIELYVSAAEVLRAIPTLPGVYDEPFADASQVPMLLVSKIASEYVKVALAGDGGDELFGGYNRYVWGERVWRYSRHIPPAQRRFLQRVAGRISARSADRLIAAVRRVLPDAALARASALKLQKFADVLAADGADAIYRASLERHMQSAGLVSELVSGHSSDVARLGVDGIADPREQMMLADLLGYLPDDLLVKTDRAAMSVGLEVRAPYLDPDVVEAAWALPLDMKFRNGKGKWVLRQLAARFLPKSVAARPKSGFEVPLGPWMRGPLRDWVCDSLSAGTIAKYGLFKPQAVQRLLDQHMSGAREGQQEIWTIVMLHDWLEKQSCAGVH